MDDDFSEGDDGKPKRLLETGKPNVINDSEQSNVESITAVAEVITWRTAAVAAAGLAAVGVAYLLGFKNGFAAAEHGISDCGRTLSNRRWGV